MTPSPEWCNVQENQFVKPGDIENGLISYREDGISFVGTKTARIVAKDSVLMVCIGTIGKACMVDREVAFNQQINAIEVNPSLIDGRYLLYVFLSSYFQKSAKSVASATTLPILNKKKWGGLYVPVPPLLEQRRISERVGEHLKQIDVLVKQK